MTSPITSKVFDDLNDDCFRVILSRFDNWELMHLRLVCSRIHTLSTETIQSRQTSLKLFPEHDSMTGYFEELMRNNLQDDQYYHLQKGIKSDELICSSPTRILPSRFLPDLFPKLTKLIIYDAHSKNIDLVHLLTKWSPKMESLTLFGPFPLLSTWCGAISSMTKLRRLDIFNANLLDFDFFKNIKLILPQLEHLTIMPRIKALDRLENSTLPKNDFSLPKERYAHRIKSILLNLKPDKIRHLNLIGMKFSLEDFNELLSSKPDLATKLTHLTVCFEPESKSNKKGLRGIPPKVLGLICLKFYNLTFLNFCPERNFWFPDMVDKLRYLRQLIELRIFFGFFPDIRLPIHNRYIPNAKEDCLPTVRRLHLVGCKVNTEKLCSTFSVIFPNLEQLVIVESELSDYPDDVLDRLKIHFSRLQSVRYSNNDWKRFIV